MTDPDALEVKPIGTDPALLTRCVEACFEAAQACTSCADACLRDSDVAQLANCVRVNLDCADMCDATGRLLSRRAGQHHNLVRAFLDTCRATCATCAEECTQHATSYDHCQSCAEACRACEQACGDLLATL